MSRKERLNLTVDRKALERARRYSEERGTSISKLVSDYLERLPVSDDDFLEQLSPRVRRLVGITGNPDLSREDYRRYLEEKYLGDRGEAGQAGDDE